ncbi:unnamed protein product [Heligmosomoides polygyrus]|uniref:Acetyl-coenzyme A transporter 1 n=1 Tax=Heligmosomoides polygyrus TaxID=6339 RepID=A0A183G6U3_HELPZ|nr:unnamed protein product [Heligmosomoides polygyrus]
MAKRVRRRNRGGFRSSEDVMANEPDFAFSDAGPHAPMVFHRAEEQDEDGKPLYGDTVSCEAVLLPRIPGPNKRASLPAIMLCYFVWTSSLRFSRCALFIACFQSVDSSGSWFSRTRETLRGDLSSICLLLFLYLLQGVPLGLIGAIPLLLQGKHVSYGQQAIFSFAYWPFSMKLLWAPVVDSVYWRRIGRRKSWMVPCQYLIGLFMLLLSFRVPYIMGEGTGDAGPNVLFLMLIFLPLNFLAATQDIAVDGWALTILSRKNVGYASTCNAVGQTAGYFLGNVVFLSLESADFANTFIRSADNQQPYGIIDLAGFVFFWGWIFIISTTLVLIFKKEVDNSLESSSSSDDGDKELELGIVETYGVLWKILKLKPMLFMLVILLTGKVAFAATDGITGLKLIGMGMPKDRLASFGLFLTPLQIMLPWMIGKWTAGPRPLNIFLLAYPYR